MCDHHGCRDFPLIGRPSAEHGAIAITADRPHTVTDSGDPAILTARDELAALLPPHTAIDEGGLFPAAVLIPAWDRITPAETDAR